MSWLRVRYVAVSGIGLGSKLLVVFFFAWRFAPQTYALLVQVQAQLTLWVLLVGLDLYVFFDRRWVQGGRQIPRDELGWFLTFASVGYAVLVPAVLALSTLKPLHTALLLAVVLTEHLSQEMNRLLLAFELHMQAVTVQFLRNTLWGVVFVSVAVVVDLPDPLAVFLALWSVGGVLAVSVGALFLRRLVVRPSGGQTAPLFRALVAVVLPSIASTLSVRAMLSADRLVASASLPAGEIAAYGLYVAVGAGAVAITDICVIAFSQPRLLHLLRSDASAAQLRSGQALMHRAMWQTLGLNGAIGLAGWGFIVVALDAVYASKPNAFVIVQLGYLAFTLSHVPGGVLYARGRFKLILMATVSAALVFGAALFGVATFGLGLTELALATCLSFLLLFVAELVAAEREFRSAIGAG